MADWSWHPSACSLESFDAIKLAQKLAGRYLLMIGDSLMVGSNFLAQLGPAAELFSHLPNPEVTSKRWCMQVQQFFALKKLMQPAISKTVDPHDDWEHFYTKK